MLSRSNSSSSSKWCLAFSTGAAAFASTSLTCWSKSTSYSSDTFPWNLPDYAFWIMMFSRVSALPGLTAAMAPRRLLASSDKICAIIDCLYARICSFCSYCYYLCWIYCCICSCYAFYRFKFWLKSEQNKIEINLPVPCLISVAFLKILTRYYNYKNTLLRNKNMVDAKA